MGFLRVKHKMPKIAQSYCFFLTYATKNRHLGDFLLFSVWHIRFMSFGLNRFEFATREVMGKDLLVGITLVSHDGSTDLAQTYTVSPSCTRQDKVACLVAINHKCTTVQVALA